MDGYIIWQDNLGNGSVLVASLEDGRIIASEGADLFGFVLKDGTYNSIEASLGDKINSLLVIPPETIITAQDKLICGLRLEENSFTTLFCFKEKGTYFRNLAQGDLDRDGYIEIVASSRNNIYVYRLLDNKLELLGIRVAEGKIKDVAIFNSQEEVPLIAVLWEGEDSNKITTYRLMERGFLVNSFLDRLPKGSNILISGDFIDQKGEELALGSGDGRVYIIEEAVDKTLKVSFVTSVLGNKITALSPYGEAKGLLAGTSGGYVFIFSPLSKEPNGKIRVDGIITGLAWDNGKNIAIGTSKGDLKVGYWQSLGTYYTVKEKDTLWSIAKNFNLEVEDLMVRNGISHNLIYPGQILLLND